VIKSQKPSYMPSAPIPISNAPKEEEAGPLSVAQDGGDNDDDDERVIPFSASVGVQTEAEAEPPSSGVSLSTVEQSSPGILGVRRSASLKVPAPSSLDVLSSSPVTLNKTVVLNKWQRRIVISKVPGSCPSFAFVIPSVKLDSTDAQVVQDELPPDDSTPPDQ